MKIVRDTVHGYIKIPKKYFDALIDTKIFQRLRRIEQTSMRILYPCAHHDRFSHSIGVYHLAYLSIQSIEQNSDVIKGMLDKPDYKKIKESFLIASLLHDCGHAPFSHRTEHFYDLQGVLIEAFSELFKDNGLRQLVKKTGPKPHEYASAYLCMTLYRDAIIKLGGNPELVALMIIGCKYSSSKSLPDIQSLSNVFIRLLNGRPIDIDRLDYLLRDRWASGVASYSVDVMKLISGISVIYSEESYELVFHKNSINAVQSVNDARNHFRLWVYGHQKVRYDDYLLDKSIKKMDKLLSENGSTSALSKIYSMDRFKTPERIGNFSVHLPTDDDIIYMLKSLQADIPEFDQWLYRQNHRTPVWKNHIDFFHIFDGVDPELMRKNNVLRAAAGEVEKEYDKEVIFIDVEPGLTEIDRNQLKIMVDGKPVCYSRLTQKTSSPIPPNYYFYGYLKKGSIVTNQEVISELIRKVR